MRPTSRSGRLAQGLPKTPSLEARLAGDLELGPGEEAEWRMLASGVELLNASTMKHGKAVIEKIAGIEPARQGADLLPAVGAGCGTHPRSRPSRPARCIPGSTGPFRYTRRHIQGFPDSYVFCGPAS